jgi:hypothetical protein
VPGEHSDDERPIEQVYGYFDVDVRGLAHPGEGSHRLPS